MEKLWKLKADRAELVGGLKAIHKNMQTLNDKADFDAEDQKSYDALKADFEAKNAEIAKIEARISREEEVREINAKTAQPADSNLGHNGGPRLFAQAKDDKYEKEKSLILGGCVKMIGMAGGDVYGARSRSIDIYGENHPVTKALVTATGSAGGFIVPPDVYNEVIELLRARAVVRAANPRNIPMPRGTLTIPGAASAATATYGSENKTISSSQPTLRQIVASYKKLTALVPISNDLMRYSDPAVDAFVRDDLVKVIALREDLAFFMGDGTGDTPRGWLSFANGWVISNGGTGGVWSQSANSTLAVNGADPANTTGGNFITSNATYTLTTVAQELAGAVNRLDTANVPDSRRRWFFNPRTKNYLYNVQNSLGLYVYRDEMNQGKLLGYPFSITTQIPINYWDAAGSNKDLSFVFLAEMDEAMLLDSMQLEIAVSREGMYVDSVTSATVSAFQSDQTIIRAIAEHDFQVRHDQSVAVIQAVRWAPAIS